MAPPPAAGASSSYYLLEVTVVSAQDLHPASSSMRTYARTYVDLEHRHRHRTRVDSTGHTEPSWNDKFVFRVDDDFIRSDTSAVNVDVYASRLGLPDVLLGTARGLMSTLRPTQVTRYVALLVRRPKSLRPQGIVNVGISLLDPHVRSLPLQPHPAPAVAGVPDSATPEKAKAEAPVMSKAKSVGGGPAVKGGKIDKEKEELEMKLKKWKQELRPPRKEPKDVEKRVGVRIARDDLEGTRRLARKPSVGNVAGFSVWNAESGELAVAAPRPRPPPPPRTVKEQPLRERAMRNAMERS